MRPHFRGLLRRALALYAAIAVAVWLAPASIGQTAKPTEGQQALSAALRTMFSPRRSPGRRTMGLAQRNFLDLVERSQSRVEVALVIDATDSMAPALEPLRDAVAQMMGDLDLYRQRQISYQLVVYRDVGAPSGEVSFPLDLPNKAFTDNRDQVLAAIQELSTETGAPYFPEVVDRGVHQALTQLNWSEDDSVSRWLFLFGDAPPFDPTVQEEETRAARLFSTDALVALARSKEIKINCVLCPTRPQDQRAQQAVIDQLRAFMSAISTGTGGLLLDLSYREIRAAMLQADAVATVEFTPVDSIRREDVERLQTEILESRSGSDPPVSIAILPHAPLDRMDFASDSLGVQLASELRMRIKSIPGVNVCEPLLVQRRFNLIERNPNYSGLRGEALLQAISRYLGADYVLWGDVRAESGVRIVATRMYDAATGNVVAEADRTTSTSLEPAQLGSSLATDLLAAPLTSPAHRPLANHLAAIRNDAAQLNVFVRQISASDAHEDLTAGMAALETALAYPVGDPAGVELLQEARQRLEAATRLDGDNALPHYLLANCLYNLAKREQAAAESGALIKEFGRELRAAYRFRNDLKDEQLRLEIEADYALLVRGRPDEAIPKYVKLADAAADTDAARRANWMLAGIYGGDWGVDQQYVDRQLARERFIRILAAWPDSGEAQFIRRVLRWDEQRGETQFHHFPKENETLASQMDREA